MGTQLVERLRARGERVRILTRDPKRASRWSDVEVVVGDVRDAAAVERAVSGVRAIVSAVHGFADARGGPRGIDREGNMNLIAAARAGSVADFVLLSVHGAAPDHPADLFREKHRAEEALRASDLSWTILRPTAFMETWAIMLADPLVEHGRTLIFGRGDNPINFISVYDVARFVEEALFSSSLRGQVVEIGGPENLTFKEFVAVFESVTGKSGAKRHVPLPMMRVMSWLMRPIHPVFARKACIGTVMDTTDMVFDAAPVQTRFPHIALTRWEDAVRRDYVR